MCKEFWYYFFFWDVGIQKGITMSFIWKSVEHENVKKKLLRRDVHTKVFLVLVFCSSAFSYLPVSSHIMVQFSIHSNFTLIKPWPLRLVLSGNSAEGLCQKKHSSVTWSVSVPRARVCLSLLIVVGRWMGKYRSSEESSPPLCVLNIKIGHDSSVGYGLQLMIITEKCTILP